MMNILEKHWILKIRKFKFILFKAPCDSNPCFNDGTCSGSETSPFYSCECPNGYDGDQCEECKNIFCFFLLMPNIREALHLQSYFVSLFDLKSLKMQ